MSSGDVATSHQQAGFLLESFIISSPRMKTFVLIYPTGKSLRLPDLLLSSPAGKNISLSAWANHFYNSRRPVP